MAAPPSRPPIRPPIRPPPPTTSTSSTVRPVRPALSGPSIFSMRPRPPIGSASGSSTSMQTSAPDPSGPVQNAGFNLSVTGGTVGPGGGPPGAIRPRPSFRPVAPVRRIKTEDLPPPPPPTNRGRPPRPPRGRGRGRGAGGPGGSRNGGDDPYGGAVASGPFALGPSNIARSRATPIMAPISAPSGSGGANNSLFVPTGEAYSDEEYGGKDIIDMELVPTLSGASAPTALLRDRSVQEAIKKRERQKELNRERKIREKKKEGVKEEVREAARAIGRDAPDVKAESGAETSTKPGTTSANPDFRVKDEPISPEIVAQSESILEGLANGTGAPQPHSPSVAAQRPRDNDTLQDDDMERDVDVLGRSLALPISVTNSIDGNSRAGTPGSNGELKVEGLLAEVQEAAKKAVDLSDSESEDEEEDMTGDFVHEPGKENPNDKIYLFQFPVPFPHYTPHPGYSLMKKIPPVPMPNVKAEAPAPDKDQDKTADLKPILKKNVNFFDGDEDMDKPEAEKPKALSLLEEEKAEAAAKAEKDRIALEQRKKEAYEKAKADQIEKYKRMEAARKPEGRIGTLVVMKSGRVKIVLGNGIVMDATPGVPTTFVQQLVHLDQKEKTASVLGEINKSYVVTPDIDRLPEELRILDGVVPGENDADVKPKIGQRGDVKPVIKRE